MILEVDAGASAGGRDADPLPGSDYRLFDGLQRAGDRRPSRPNCRICGSPAVLSVAVRIALIIDRLRAAVTARIEYDALTRLTSLSIRNRLNRKFQARDGENAR